VKHALKKLQDMGEAEAQLKWWNAQNGLATLPQDGQ